MRFSVSHVSILAFLMLLIHNAEIRAEAKVMIIIIDGARYTETFGDPHHAYIPHMWNLRTEGSYLTSFQNDSITYTSRAIPALWCGTWTDVRDTVWNGNNTQYAVQPTLFEYYRGQKNRPAEDCFYVLKFINSLWLPSFHPDYGPPTWPRFHSVGSTDADVSDQAQWVMSTFHPNFLWVYLADVDGAGHRGIWSDYVGAIASADSIVGVLWNALQSDPFYQDSTYLFVTNDHGRHDDQHGGFTGHGDGCPGCRQIMFLALGPGIRSNYVSSQYRRIPDLAVTTARLLGLNPEYASGEIMAEILQPTGLEPGTENPQSFTLLQNYPNPFNPATTIEFTLNQAREITLSVFDQQGKKVADLAAGKHSAGKYRYTWHAGSLPSGIYYYRLFAGNYSKTRKALLLK